MLTIVYTTFRKEPHFDWFLNSLRDQMERCDTPETRIVFVDSHANPSVQRYEGVIHIKPKPNVWSGPHRLTKEDWFSAASARNTGLCLAPDGHIAFTDDLSYLEPGWLEAVLDSMKGGYVACGSYRKVKEIYVEGPAHVSWQFFPQGVDSRWSKGSDTGPVPCGGDFLFGCSVAMPVETLLAVGGWPEMCDGLGFEDVCLGVCLQNAGYPLKYDRRMLTLESAEAHELEPSPRRSDYGVSINDKSHSALRIAQQSKYFPNYYEGGIRALRQHVLAGNPFPVVQSPEHEWFTGVALKDL